MSKSTFGLRRAGLATLAVTLTLGAAGIAAPAQADWAATGGEIGLVDTDGTTDDNQGAALLYPGVDGQELGDVRLLIPNSFANGDTIDLAIYDRTATAGSPGQINADAAHKLGFTSAPTVTVDQTPYVAASSITPDTDAVANNTETELTEYTGDDKPTTAPQLNAQVVQSSRANGLATDIIRLTVSGVQDNGNTEAEWVVTLSDLMVDLGAAVSPGELRVVPFAYNGTPSQTNTNTSPVFGNVADDPSTAGYDAAITHYTVPGYVSPVEFNVGTPNSVLADGTTQRVGDITIEETNGYSLQGATYTVEVNGADVRNDADSPVSVTLSGGAEGETVTEEATVSGDELSFTLTEGANSDNTESTITLSGLLLGDNSPGDVTYTLSGGSIDNGPDAFLVQAGTSGTIGTPPNDGVAPDSTFVPEVGDESSEYSATTGVNQKDILPPTQGLTIESVSTDVERRIGGGNRYETAAKIALNNAGGNDYVVLASGQNFPDALSSNYLANQVGGGSILLTKEDSIPQPTLSAMRELGTRTVFVVGGEGAIDDDVVRQLRNTPQYYPGGRETIGQGKLHVVRLAGDNRYETNREVNEYGAAMFQGANPVGRTNIEFGESSKLTAFLATGQKYADALAAGPATTGIDGMGNLPLILTKSGDLHEAAEDQLTNLGIEQVVVVGGEGAVDADVVDSVESMDIDVVRIEGSNRYDTAAHLADFMIADAQPTASMDGGLGFDQWNEGEDWELAYLATGQKYADALAGGPLAGGMASPILLTKSDELSTETEEWFSAHEATYSTVVALGLGGAVAPSVLDDANAAIAGR